ncbi:MAG: hypothetical protein HP494_05375 [Nitrospira sp.]|nr:hypothetical protein [Nitrospira sp.]
MRENAQRTISWPGSGDDGRTDLTAWSRAQDSQCHAGHSLALAALAQEKLSALAVVGGVSANSRLRGLLNEWAERKGFRLAVPPMAYCTDNAAMIASAGRHVLMSDPSAVREFDIQPSLQVEPLSRPVRREEITHS